MDILKTVQRSMKRTRPTWIFLAFCITGLAFSMPPRRGNMTYAQKLVDDTLATHPGLVSMALHVTPPKSSENVVIASNFGQIGRKSAPEDVEVMETGRPKAEVTRTGKHFRVELPLHDVGGKTIGALSLTFPFSSVADAAKLQEQAARIRDEVSRRITYVANLFEPAQFDASIPTNTYAQKLVDEILARHPEVLILALHVTPPHRTDNVIIASNIGRIGKKADEDDMNVVRTGSPNLEVNSCGDRFEAELALLNVSGERIGAVSVVLAYRPGDDKAKLEQTADKVRDELRGNIPNIAKLFEQAR